MDLDGFIFLDKCLGALLAHAVFATERHSVTDGEGFTDEGTKTGLRLEAAEQSEPRSSVRHS